MRIISGIARGTKLLTLSGNEITRPTLDRVKEALFSSIQEKIIDAKILDLFAGSGALGLEALSRGADCAVFCDSSKEAIGIIKQNISKTHMQEKCEVLLDNYSTALAKLENKMFDIIFLDAPYASDYDMQALDIIEKKDILAKDGIIILETDSDKKIEDLNKLSFNILKIRKYGRVKLVFLNRKG